MKKVLLSLSIMALSAMSCLAIGADEQKAYDDFMLKLKACTPASAELFDGKHEVFGYNQGCGYRVQFKTGDSYTCKFPTAVAEMYGYQATKTLREGVKNTFAEGMLNGYYCQKN